MKSDEKLKKVLFKNGFRAKTTIKWDPLRTPLVVLGDYDMGKVWEPILGAETPQNQVKMRSKSGVGGWW